MRKTSLRMIRGLMVFMVALGLLGLTAGPAGAQGEFCAPQADWFILGLVDPTEDGVISIADLQFIANGLPAGEQKDTFNGLIAQAEAAGVTGIRYNDQGACAPPATATTVPAATATTVPGATATTVPAATATTVPGATATTVPAATATTVPGATATTVPGATATTVPATTVPGDDDDNGVATTAPDDDDNGAVVTLPETGQGPGASQGNSTFVLLLGGMSLLMGAAVLWGKRRTA